MATVVQIPADPIAAVGPRIRALREAMSLSLRDLADRGCGVLLVTHSLEVVAVADRVVTLSDGRVVA